MLNNILSGMTWQQAVLKTKFFKAYAYIKYKNEGDKFKVIMEQISSDLSTYGYDYVESKLEEYFEVLPEGDIDECN